MPGVHMMGAGGPHSVAAAPMQVRAAGAVSTCSGVSQPGLVGWLWAAHGWGEDCSCCTSWHC